MNLLSRRWFQIFISGLLLLYAIEKTLISTNNPNFVPGVILLGAFIVPVTFVIFIYESLPHWEVSFPPLAICLLGGGVIGTVVAGTLEYDVLKTLGFLPMLAIGLI